MFPHNFVKLSAAVRELSCYREKDDMLKTILPSLPRAAIIQ